MSAIVLHNCHNLFHTDMVAWTSIWITLVSVYKKGGEYAQISEDFESQQKN